MSTIEGEEERTRMFHAITNVLMGKMTLEVASETFIVDFELAKVCSYVHSVF